MVSLDVEIVARVNSSSIDKFSLLCVGISAQSRIEHHGGYVRNITR